MNTKARVPRSATKSEQAITLTPDTVRVWLPEEIEQERLLPCKARWLKEKAYKREIPHTTVAGKVGFRLEHILAISAAGDVDPADYGRQLARTA